MYLDALLDRAGFTISHTEEQNARKGVFLPCPGGLRPEITDYVARQYPDGLYKHQAIAIEKVLRGKNLVICTGTASGKTVAFALPVFDALLEDVHARAMFFYPTKALTPLSAMPAVSEISLRSWSSWPGSLAFPARFTALTGMS